MRALRALLLLLVLLLPACAPMTPVCRSQVGLVERALGDAKAALALPAMQQDVPLDELPIRSLATKRAPLAAIMLAAGRITVLYDRERLDAIACQYGYDAVVGVFAHELGHLLDILAGLEGDELSADAWAGCAIAIIGGDITGYQRLALTFGVDEEHPPGKVRGAAARAGYDVCSHFWR